MKRSMRAVTSAFALVAALSLPGATPPQLSDVNIALDPTNRTVNVTYALDREAIVTVAFEADGEPVGDRAVRARDGVGRFDAARHPTADTATASSATAARRTRRT